MDATYYPARIMIYLEVLLPFVKDVVRISPPLKNSCYCDASRHHHSFLGPRVEWTLLCEFKTSSNHIALKIMVDISFLDHWISDHHSKHWSCTYAHISGAPFNQCLLVDVLLEHTSLYHLIWQVLSPCSDNYGNPSFGNLNDLSLSPSATS